MAETAENFITAGGNIVAGRYYFRIQPVNFMRAFGGISLLVTFRSIVAISLLSIQSITFADNNRPIAPTTQPSVTLKPKDVVEAIVIALGKNDVEDTGIKITWMFASPDNKKATGPLQKFIPMVKNAAYGALLNHQSSEIRELGIKDDHAAELTVITDHNGDKAYFVFQLSKQHDGDCKDCWMVDGVMRVQPPAAPPKNPNPTLPDGQSPA